MIATERPLNGNGEPMAITATSSGAAQTIFVSRAANVGWDKLELFVMTTGQQRDLFIDIGGGGVFLRVNVIAGSSPVLALPERLTVQGGLKVKAYASAANTSGTLYVFGNVIEVRQE